MPTSEEGPVEPVISLEELVWVHTVAVTEFGGSQGIRDRGLLESAIARPLATFGGKYLYDTPFKRAAALAESLVLNHGFVDGNKRSAMYAMAAWLEREGYMIDAARGELRDLALAIASHQLSTEQISAWLVQRCNPT
ncbi:MAG: type II toxin-antitoxin system death-on-curing family toxin [Candidatus Dormibacteraeota bacterium]|nr:type II toxin-antitoxin system death-on-curing family toxin [Candidatus Dormibacteraeota bacterium]